MPRAPVVTQFEAVSLKLKESDHESIYHEH